MKPFLQLVKLPPTPILQQLQWEEALLRTDDRNWCILNRGSPPAIVTGISGKIDSLVCLDKLRRAPIPLIRRFSGGGTVIVDENTLFVTLICRTDALTVAPFPRPVMEWTAQQLYGPLFSKHSFELQENDYVLEGRKWGGNAQSLTKERWLHHSSLLWDYCPEKMDYLLLPPKMPSYRQKREHVDFLCRLKDYWTDPAYFQSKIIEQLGQHFTLIEKGTNELEQAVKLPHRKATTQIEF